VNRLGGAAGALLPPLLAVLAATTLTVLLYLPTLDLPHAAEWYPENNIDRVERLRLDEILHSRPPYYRPGMLWLNQLWFRLGGPERNPARDRTVILLVHAACVAIVIVLAWIGTRRSWPALAAGLFLALHPSLVGAVTYEAVRWYVTGVFAFLILVVSYTWVLARPDPGPPRVVLVGLGLLLLPLALFSELGALGCAILAVWLFIETKPRGAAWLRWAVLPALLSGAMYLALRWHAFGGSFGQPYVSLAGGPLLRARLWALGFIHEVTLLLLPLRLPFLAVDGSSRLALAGAFIFCVTLVFGPLLWPAVRRLLRENPLPSAGLVLYGLFQLNAVWLQARAPIARAGSERSYVAYLPVVFIALLMAATLAQAASRLATAGRRAMGVAVAAVFVAAALTAREAVALVREAGEMLREDERRLTPFLRELPPRTEVAVYGLPDMLRRPYLPWAHLYHFSRPLMLSTWAGKPLVVYWGLGEAPPPIGFDGWVIERTGRVLRWHRESASGAIETWTRRAEALPVAEPLNLWSETVDVRDLAMEHRSSVGFEARVTGPDPRLSREVDVDPARYGVLRCDLRVEGAPPASWRVQAYFRPREKEASERTAAFVEVPLDTQWRTVAIPLFGVPTWVESEAIDALRLHLLRRPVPVQDYLRPPTSMRPGALAVRSLRLESGRNWAIEARERLPGRRR
jgi:hypothetical protein